MSVVNAASNIGANAAANQAFNSAASAGANAAGNTAANAAANGPEKADPAQAKGSEAVTTTFASKQPQAPEAKKPDTEDSPKTAGTGKTVDLIA